MTSNLQQFVKEQANLPQLSKSCKNFSLNN
jgi:hypothetical protein